MFMLFKVEEHLAGKTHLAGIKQIQHSLQIISVGNFCLTAFLTECRD
jgi:tRNA threonylcarbamoyladenosine modification (KEOPS) complex Cgi121 subunit